MSVLDGIREARDSLVKYLSLVGGNGSSSERTEQERSDHEKFGSTVDLMSQAVKIISDVPEESWSKQSSGLVEHDKTTVTQEFAAVDLTEEYSEPAVQERDEKDNDTMEVENTKPVDEEPAQVLQHVVENTPAIVSAPSSASLPSLPRAATFSNTYATGFAESAYRTAPARSSSIGSNLSSIANDKLSLEGFTEVKKLLQPHQSSSSSKGRKRPYMSLGDLGINEGWTTILTNAAYCFDNTPAEGWRREVAVRMSGKSKGSTDIHYVTPDKRKRFRSRQELSLYLARTNSNSMSFLNSFEFRAAFCLCHEPEDNSRSYVECSYGLAGCNRWLHAECLGLGARSEQELALMPKVICPYCAAYLKGAGELESFVTPDMYVMDRMPELPEEEEDDDAIEESAEPHLLWGLQGSPFVYCGVSNASGLDAPPGSEEEDFAEGPATSSEMASPRRGQASSSASQPEEIGKIMQHRLFQSWPPNAEKEREKEKAPAPSPPRRAPRPAVVPPTPPPVVAVVLSDDDEGVPSNKLGLDPGERVRRARHADGSTSMVRVQGGWMRQRPLESSPDPAITPSDQEAENMKQRIIAKAAARKAAAPSINAPSVLARRYKNELIEAVVNSAKSSSNRPKHSFDVQRLASALVASVEPVPAHVLSELRDAYQAKPCLSYLPLEDGGLRYGAASYANVPRSLHAFCMANLVCGVCLNSTDDDLIMIQGSGENAYAPLIPDGTENGKGKSKKSKKAHEPKVSQFVEPELDRYNLVPLTCGTVTYSAHKQCAHEGERPLRDVDHCDTKVYMELGAVHEYEQVDDADCDLCGRKGGLMRYFTIAAESSSIPPPNEEGWLAHIPCMTFLHAGGLLRPLSAGKGSVFDVNFFSHRVGWTSASSDSSAMEVEEDTSATNADKITECNGGALVVTPHAEATVPTAATADIAASASRGEGEDRAEARKTALLEEDRLHGRAPLSRFDQLHGQCRCTLCGLQTGVALRCAAAGCALRAHPLCVQACGDPAWQLCSARTAEDTDESKGGSLLVLCSLHSVHV